MVTIMADIYNRDKKVGRIEIKEGVLLKNECYIDNIFDHPCPRSKTACDVLGILANRVLKPCRCDDWLLNKMGLKEYNVWKIFRINHGVDGADTIWFKFDDDDESLCFDDLRVR